MPMLEILRSCRATVSLVRALDVLTGRKSMFSFLLPMGLYFTPTSRCLKAVPFRFKKNQIDQV